MKKPFFATRENLFVHLTWKLILVKKIQYTPLSQDFIIGD
jgi:hypothetical protein